MTHNRPTAGPKTLEQMLDILSIVEDHMARTLLIDWANLCYAHAKHKGYSDEDAVRHTLSMIAEQLISSIQVQAS